MRPARYVVNAVKQNVGTGQSDMEIFQFNIWELCILHLIQIYCTAVAATASVMVKRNGVNIISAQTPVAGTPVVVTPDDKTLKAGDNLTVHVTTDATGTITDLNVSLVIKQQEEILV